MSTFLTVFQECVVVPRGGPVRAHISMGTCDTIFRCLLYKCAKFQAHWIKMTIKNAFDVKREKIGKPRAPLLCALNHRAVQGLLCLLRSYGVLF